MLHAESITQSEKITQACNCVPDNLQAPGKHPKRDDLGAVQIPPPSVIGAWGYKYSRDIILSFFPSWEILPENLKSAIFIWWLYRQQQPFLTCENYSQGSVYNGDNLVIGSTSADTRPSRLFVCAWSIKFTKAFTTFAFSFTQKKKISSYKLRQTQWRWPIEIRRSERTRWTRANVTRTVPTQANWWSWS